MSSNVQEGAQSHSSNPPDAAPDPTPDAPPDVTDEMARPGRLTAKQRRRNAERVRQRAVQAVREAQRAQQPSSNPVDPKYRHVEAVHSTSRPSCLSHDSEATPSFIGFRNLMIICLVAGNLRLMIENMQKYGVLICVRCHDVGRRDLIGALVLYILVPCHLLVAYWIEKYAANRAVGSKKRSEKTTGGPTKEEAAAFRRTWITLRWLHALNVVGALTYTSYWVYYHIHHPLVGTFTELHAIIVLLKTSSYALTNRDLRHAFLHPSENELAAVPDLYAECPYPKNITIANMCYFWWAPTLVYQPVYPRTPEIRWIFALKRLTEAFCLGVFIWFMSAQYASPLLRNSLDKIDSLDYASMLERLLKLSTVSLVIWLAGFFAFFQSALNALAEITRFGDRSFYDDWWNSVTVGGYWRTWNKPVYKFFRRHVFSPMVARGYSPKVAGIVVFFLSAILHELLVGIPTHIIFGLAFVGMMVQVLLVSGTKYYFEQSGSNTRKIMGNVLFWVSFTIVGQPIVALMYYYFWQGKYGSVSKLRSSA